MLKNSQTTYCNSESSHIRIAPNHEIDKIWAFIDSNIFGFVPYYQSVGDSNRENRISDFLTYYFNCCISEKAEGFLPYYFGKNPTQPQSGRETDIGVFANISNAKPITLIEFEAKCLSNKSNNKEYVCGKRGGIERFKRGLHASHLSVCGMFAYVQDNDINYWKSKVDKWIYKLSESNTDSTIRWSNEEVLHKINSSSQIEKYFSAHQRLSLNDTITLWHYFIKL
jgi:hypothetical protein